MKFRRQLLLLLVLFVFSTCSGEADKSNKDETPVHDVSNDFDIKIALNPKYSIDIMDVTKISDYACLIHIRLNNTGDDAIYYLSNSCYGLSSFVEFKSPFYFCPEITCDYSLPIIHELLPNDSYKFTLRICSTDVNKLIEEGDFNLNLVCVDRYLEEEAVRKWSEKHNTNLVEWLKVFGSSHDIANKRSSS